MRIITLNTWSGKAGKKKLLEFFEKHKNTTDLFCLQEIWSAPPEDMKWENAGGTNFAPEQTMMYGAKEISELLSDHNSYFRPHFLDKYGIMMLVKKNLIVVEEGEEFVHRHSGYLPKGDAGNHARNIQYVTLDINGKPLTVINFHGLWNGKGKTDSEDRINQSKKILEFTKNLSGDFVLCGDFNLLPETESLKMFETSGLRNLIKEYGVKSTRTSHYTKDVKYADYIFTTKGLDVKDFRVLPDEVSDHTPLLIEF